ncbi:MAG: DNA integrity scanning protein DisA [Actinobacteria bacterium]|nr:DNA integrity scanning protein DisA [Actinomycetota bacterium]
MFADKRKEQILIKVLETVAPGTKLRLGLEHIISAKTGALIVVGDTESIMSIANGGFHLDCEFSSQKLFELAKMDGAIILDRDVRRILYANVHLVPDSLLPTDETGMRHRTAERVAKQTKALVISISQKRDVVSLYIDDIKYSLEDIRIILTKANQALQTLEKYKLRLDQVSSNLNALEFEDLVTLIDVITVIQRSEMVERIANEIGVYISELGVDGRLIRMQLDELMGNVVEDSLLVIKDYHIQEVSAEEVKRQLSDLSSENLLDFMEIARILGYEGTVDILDSPAHPGGCRLLRKIPRLPASVVDKIVERFGTLQHVLQANIEELDDVDGIGEVRAKAIQDGLKRLKEYNLLERYV